MASPHCSPPSRVATPCDGCGARIETGWSGLLDENGAYRADNGVVTMRLVTGCAVTDVEFRVDSNSDSDWVSAPSGQVGVGARSFGARRPVVGEHTVQARFRTGGLLCGPGTVENSTVTFVPALQVNQATNGIELLGTPRPNNMTNVFAGSAISGGALPWEDLTGEIPLPNHNKEPFPGRVVPFNDGSLIGVDIPGNTDPEVVSNDFDAGGRDNMRFMIRDLLLGGVRCGMLYHSQNPELGDSLTWAGNIRHAPLGSMMLASLREGFLNTYTEHEPHPGATMDGNTATWVKASIDRRFGPIVKMVSSQEPALMDRMGFCPTNEPGRIRDGAPSSNIHVYTGPTAPPTNVDGQIDPLSALQWAEWHIDVFDYLLENYPEYTGLLVVSMCWFGNGVDGPADILPGGELQADIQAGMDLLVAKYGGRLVFDRHWYSRLQPRPNTAGQGIVPTPSNKLVDYGLSGITPDDIGDLVVNTRGGGLLIGEIFSKRLPNLFHTGIGKVTHSEGEGSFPQDDIYASLLAVTQIHKLTQAWMAPWFGAGQLGAIWWYGSNEHQDGTEGGVPVLYGFHGANPGNGQSWQTDYPGQNNFTFDMLDQYKRLFDNSPMVVNPSGDTNTGLDDHGWVSFLKHRADHPDPGGTGVYVDYCEVFHRLAWMRHFQQLRWVVNGASTADIEQFAVSLAGVHVNADVTPLPKSGPPYETLVVYHPAANPGTDAGIQFDLDNWAATDPNITVSRTSRYEYSYDMSVIEHPRSQPHLTVGETARFRCIPKLPGVSLQWQRSDTPPGSNISKDVGSWYDLPGETGQILNQLFEGDWFAVRCVLYQSPILFSRTHAAAAGDY